MQYYFGKYLLSQEPERATCIARNLAYNIMDVSTGTIAGDCEQLRRSRQRQLRNQERCTAIDEYRLLYMESGDGGFVPLAQDIARLGLGPEYSQMLLEQFSGFDQAIARLETLLTPVAAKLQALLQPWVLQAQPLAAALAGLLSETGFRRKMEKTGALQRRSAAIEGRARSAPVSASQSRPRLLVRMGAGRFFPTPASPSPWSGERQRASRAGNFRRCGSWAARRGCECSGPCWTSPMSARGLSQMLDLHLGVVGRDIGNLFNAKLLTIEVVDGPWPLPHQPGIAGDPGEAS